MSNKHLLAIPVFNEERYLSGVLREARRHIDDVLVIDDGSTDRTAALLAYHRSVRVVRHAENRGYGASLATAFCYARRHGFDWLLTMDCDEQHEPGMIPRFRAACDTDRHDLISGSRYLSLDDDGDTPPADRRVINLKITRMINRRLGLNITDAFCGFKAYRVSALRHINITVPGYAMPMQFWIQAWRASWRITELPIRLIYKDPTRHFGGILDDPGSRFKHYMDVFERELASRCKTSDPVADCGSPAA